MRRYVGWSVLVVVVCGCGDVEEYQPVSVQRSTAVEEEHVGDVSEDAREVDSGLGASGSEASKQEEMAAGVAASGGVGGGPSNARDEAELILEGWRFTVEHGFAIVRGRVTNNTSRRLENVQAVAQFFTADGEFVKSAEALVEFNPILPGQTTPFEVLTTHNPAMTRASITFARLLGGTISVVEREKEEKPTPDADEVAAKKKAREELERKRRQLEEEIAAAEEKAKWRTWKTADGLHERRAKFVGLRAGKVTLEKEDGARVEVELDVLCDEDREFIRRRGWTKASRELRRELRGLGK